ncbi:hypothetical protein SLS57_001252 [Botryosphaeria dothidea]
MALQSQSKVSYPLIPVPTPSSKLIFFQKRKRPNVVLHQTERQAHASSDGADTSKPTAVYTPTQGRSHTLSIALPGSIIANAQSHDLKTAMAGAIARAAAVFSVDEIVIFDDGQSQVLNKGRRELSNGHTNGAGDYTSYTGYSDPDYFLYHLLSYLETPPNLRKALFPLHPNLRTAGTLPSLDMPHHLRAEEWCQYREGVVLDPSAYDDASSFTGSYAGSYAGSHTGSPPAPNKPSNKKHKKGKKAQQPAAPDTMASATAPHTLVDAGLPNPIQLDLPAPIPPHTRVTLRFASQEDPGEYESLEAQAVDPQFPREDAGYYWGYQTRQAGSLSAVFTECPWDGGYDISVGTSERGVPLSQILGSGAEPKEDAGGGGVEGGGGYALPVKFQHLILVFGGVSGLEVAAMADKDLVEKGVTGKNVGDIFDAWVNLVPNQGSRTIRCEEAVWLGLMAFSDYVRHNGESAARSAAGYQCLASSTNTRIQYNVSRTLHARRTFATSAPRGSEMPANMKRMVKDMQKHKAMPHTSTMTKQSIDEMPNDVGLMPDTFVRPTGAKMPSLFTEPRLRLKVEKLWVKTRFYDIVSRLVYKWSTTTKPRPVISRRGIPRLALELHKDMYTAFAYGDVQHLSRICTDGVFGSFRSRINARNPNERYYWTRLSHSRPQIVSDRVVKIPVPGVDTQKRPCCIRQVIFRIKSKQSLVKGIVRKDRNGTQKLLDAAGKELPVGEDGEVTMERMQQDAKDVQEYFVLQKRMWMGKEERWFAWGLVEEADVDKLD